MGKVIDITDLIEQEKGLENTVAYCDRIIKKGEGSGDIDELIAADFFTLFKRSLLKGESI